MTSRGAPGIIHVDMDAFYASVEQRDDPRLRGRPVIVGGHSHRGVVLAASYEVRPFGVRSAMPMVEARRRAPDAVVVPPRMAAYAEASAAVFAIFESVTPLVEPLSLDEAFLDVTGSVSLFGPPADIARHLRRRIRDELHLPASAGIAAVKFVAKIASDLAKPDGQREVAADDTVAFLAGLPIGRLWGVGRKAEARLRSFGIHTVGDLATREPDWVRRRLGAGALDLQRLARGIDDRQVIPDREARSIGAEDTFEQDLTAVEDLVPHVHAQALRVGRRLRAARLRARVVVLKVKLADFTLSTRRTTLAAATDDGQEIYRVARGLLEREPAGRAIRLTGVAAHELVGPAPQMGLFPDAPRPAVRLNAALDRIAEKFGSAAVKPADLVRGGRRPGDRGR